MTFNRDLTDRWAIALALLGFGVGGAVWVVGLGTGVGEALAAAGPVVLGATGWFGRVFWLNGNRYRRLSPSWTRLPPVDRGPERELFERAWAATSRLDRLAGRLPTATGMRVRDQAFAASRQLYALAAEASELTRLTNEIDDARLVEEMNELCDRRTRLVGESAAAVDRSLAALAAARSVHRRMSTARRLTLDRLAAGTHELESLRVRMAELVTLFHGSAAPVPPPGLHDLIIELEGLRLGLEEAVTISRATRVDLLGGLPGPDGPPGPGGLPRPTGLPG